MREEEFGEGCVAISLTEYLAWPPNIDFQTCFPSSDGKSTIKLGLTTGGTIEITITGRAGAQHRIVSPVIHRPEPTNIKFAFRWNDEDASLAVAGRIVASTKEVFGTDPIHVEPAEWIPDEKVQRELSEKAVATCSERTSAERDKKASGNDRLRSLDENVRILEKRLLALREMMEAVKDGRDHHLYGISAALRLLICKGGANFHPLLQRVAGLLDQPLLVYAYPPTVHDDSAVAEQRPLNANYSYISYEPGRGLYQTDLDDWLRGPGFVHRGELKTNNELLRLFSDKDGSHHDPCVSPAFDFWDEITTTEGPYQREILLRTSAVVVFLTRRLLRTAAR